MKKIYRKVASALGEARINNFQSERAQNSSTWLLILVYSFLLRRHEKLVLAKSARVDRKRHLKRSHSDPGRRTKEHLSPRVEQKAQTVWLHQRANDQHKAAKKDTEESRLCGKLQDEETDTNASADAWLTGNRFDIVFRASRFLIWVRFIETLRNNQHVQTRIKESTAGWTKAV